MDHTKATQWKINICVDIFKTEYDIILCWLFQQIEETKEKHCIKVEKTKKKKSTLRKKKRDITNTRKRHPFLFPSHNRIRTQLTDKSVLLTTILQADDSFSSFTFDAFPFYLPRPISTYV